MIVNSVIFNFIFHTVPIVMKFIKVCEHIEFGGRRKRNYMQTASCIILKANTLIKKNKKMLSYKMTS